MLFTPLNEIYTKDYKIQATTFRLGISTIIIVE